VVVLAVVRTQPLPGNSAPSGVKPTAAENRGLDEFPKGGKWYYDYRFSFEKKIPKNRKRHQPSRGRRNPAGITILLGEGGSLGRVVLLFSESGLRTGEGRRRYHRNAGSEEERDISSSQLGAWKSLRITCVTEEHFVLVVFFRLKLEVEVEVEQ